MRDHAERGDKSETVEQFQEDCSNIEIWVNMQHRIKSQTHETAEDKDIHTSGEIRMATQQRKEKQKKQEIDTTLVLQLRAAQVDVMEVYNPPG